MKPQFESEIRVKLFAPSGCAQSSAPGMRVHLPARDAHASFRPKAGTDVSALLSAEYGALYGEKLVKRVILVNGWLLFDFSPEFFSALVERINLTLALPEAENETHAENRMHVLARHGGVGCPDLPTFHRALLLAVASHESMAAYRRAERAANTLFHTIPPRERPALFEQCGAFGGAMLRLLTNSR